MNDDELELENEKVDPAIRHRNAALILGLLGYLEEVGPDPVPWAELVELHAGRYRMKTVENAIYDLDKFGAIQRTGKPGRRGTADTRALRLTPLGAAWLRQELLPLPGAHEEPVEAAPELLSADQVAEAYDVPVELLGAVEVHLEHDEDGPA